MNMMMMPTMMLMMLVVLLLMMLLFSVTLVSTLCSLLSSLLSLLSAFFSLLSSDFSCLFGGPKMAANFSTHGGQFFDIEKIGRHVWPPINMVAKS